MAGDRGRFVKFVRVEPSDAVCEGRTTGAEVASMLLEDEILGNIGFVASRWCPDSRNPVDAPTVLSRAIVSSDSRPGMVLRVLWTWTHILLSQVKLPRNRRASENKPPVLMALALR
jgi:hypothetical protein